MALQGMTFDRQQVTARDDSILYWRIFGQDGRISGANITYSGSTVTISTGYLLISGRVLWVNGLTTVDVSSAVSGNAGYVQIYVLADTSIPPSATEFVQASLQMQYSSTTTFPALPDTDIRYIDGQYGVELCVVQVSGNGTISGIVRTMADLRSIKYLTDARNANASAISALQTQTGQQATTITTLTEQNNRNAGRINTIYGEADVLRQNNATNATNIAAVKVTADAAATKTEYNSLKLSYDSNTFAAGDAITYYGCGWGRLTTGKTQIAVTLPMNRPILSGVTIQAANVTITPYDVYSVTGTRIVERTMPTGATYAYANDPGGINLTITLASAVSDPSIPNNSPVCIWINGWRIVLT